MRPSPAPLLLLAAALASASAAAPADPLTADIRHWEAFLKDNPAQDDIWKQVKQASEPVLARVEQALGDGQRLLALQRLSLMRVNLAAAEWAAARPAAERTDLQAFEAEWKRMGESLRPELEPQPDAFARMQPAALQAVAGTAASQVRAFYEASLEYGRSTELTFGLFYLGQAQAASDFVALCRRIEKTGSLEAGVPHRPPALRPLKPELDALESDLLAAYRPPVSIDRHGEFIAASSALNVARALDAAGLRPAALLGYLDASLRAAAFRPAAAAGAAPIEERLGAIQKRLDASATDATIARIYVESARSNLGANPQIAETIVSDVLPRYFEALAQPKPPAPPVTPRVTVTLVRWPFT